jgi:PAS domain S-box-containing protein/putative nucleotidyltransferase with HDIG domain
MKHSARLLVVDDDANLRKTLSDILRFKGYEVAVAGTGADGIAEAKRTFVNVALIDLRLPDMTGMEVMERIKQVNSLTEAIILTGHAALDTAIEATNKGAFSYLVKPYEIDDLLLHIRHAVERQQAQQEIVRLSSFPMLSPNPIVEVDATGEITYSNPATHEFFPDLAAAGAAHPLLASLPELFIAFRAGERQELVRQAQIGERIFELRISFTADTGRIRIYVLDITERVRTESALNESEQRFKAIIENAQDGILLADLQDKKLTLANPRICEMLGCGPDEITALGIADIHPEKDLPHVLEQFEKQARRELSIARDIPVKRKDGSVFFADINSFPVTLGGRQYLAGFFRDVSDRKAYETKISSLVALLSTTLTINNHLLVAQNEDELFRYVCTALQGLENVAGVILGLKMPDHVLKPVAWSGFDERMMSAISIRWDDTTHGRGVMGTAAREGRPVNLAGIDDDPRYAPWQEHVRTLQIRSAAAVPLVADGEVTGALAVYSRRPHAFDDEAIKVLADVANDIAIGVRSQHLTSRLEATLGSLRESLYGTVKAVARMVELRDPYTAGHQRRVAQLAHAIGKEMGLPERQVEGLRVIGYLHDIGKIAVPAEILSKPAKLTDIELAMVRSHARTGYDTLKGLSFPWPVADALLQHHERLDGSGYPAGLKAQDIILEAKVLMVADVVEAMATHRPYRASLGLEAAITEISSNKGRLYDPDVVDACVRLLVEQRFLMNGEQ